MSESKIRATLVILVVDNEPLIRVYAADVLREAGWMVLEASNATKALRILESRADIDVLFTDIQMPGGPDGIQLAHEVHRRWPRIVPLLTSGRVRVQPHELPKNGKFLPKPYNAEILVKQIGELVASHD